ncbi:PaaI family thioesterase [Mycobacterium sp. BMJ-28]
MSHSSAASYPLNTPPGRFGITNLATGAQHCAATMPLAGLDNPFTGAPSLAPLAVLVDHIAGFTNHLRRPDGHWTVSSELTMEFTPDAQAVLAADPATPVLAESRPVGAATTTSLSACDLSHGGVGIGVGTVRTFYIAVSAPAAPATEPTAVAELLPTTLGGLMAVQVAEAGGADPMLVQHANPAVNNTMGAVHGGVAAAGLELVAAAALATGASGATGMSTATPLRTASLRVNYLRRLISGDRSHYTATALHSGRSSGVADARAFDADGRLALVGRLTAYL